MEKTLGRTPDEEETHRHLIHPSVIWVDKAESQNLDV